MPPSAASTTSVRPAPAVTPASESVPAVPNTTSPLPISTVADDTVPRRSWNAASPDEIDISAPSSWTVAATSTAPAPLLAMAVVVIVPAPESAYDVVLAANPTAAGA